jgi:hypothetical protein
MDFSSARIQALFPSAKKLLDRIRKTPFWMRLGSLIALMLLCWVIICQALLSWHQRIKDLSGEISVLTHRGEALEKQKILYEKMKKQILSAPRDYIKQTIETIPLLQGEHQRVAALAKQFPDNPSLKERLLFLESGQNQIRFEHRGDDLDLYLTHRVQMDLSDLRKFLEAVEGDRYDATQKKPFLVMKKFDLLKCYEKGDEKVYSIHAELLEKK